MLFNSLQFLFFFTIVAIASFTLPHKWRWMLLPELDHLKIAFISISYFSFSMDNGRFTLQGDKSRNWIRIEMYASYPFSFPFIRGDLPNYLKGMLHPLITPDHFEGVFRNPLKKLPPIVPTSYKRTRPPALADLKKAVLGQKSKETRSSLAHYAVGRARQLHRIMANMKKEHPGLAADARDALVDTISGLKKRQVQVVLFTPPYHQSYNAKVNNRAQREMYRQVRDVVRKTGAAYYDFSRHPDFQNRPYLFSNADHLTDMASRLFSRKLLEAMEADPGLKHVLKNEVNLALSE